MPGCSGNRDDAHAPVGADPAFSLHDVSLQIGSNRVLDGVNWQVNQGENWALLGPNGSGKTSLLTIINAYRWPSSGSVSILGRKFGESDLSELRTEIGLVSAVISEKVSGEIRVADLVMSGKFGATRLWERTTKADLAQAASILDSMGSLKLLRRLVSELSQGERQKVLIARALMARPKLLVLDEPCEGLDFASREDFLGGLDSTMRSSPTTFVLVTHRTEDIPSAVTHVFLLRHGRMVAAGRKQATLTAANLARCFGRRLRLKRWGARYYMVPAVRPSGS